MRLYSIFTMFGVLVVCCSSQPAVAQRAQNFEPVPAVSAAEFPPSATGSGLDNRAANRDSTLKFQFQESDWSEVIPWFAEQAGYSLQPISDWPEGTFYLKDDSDYTVMDALDQLNHALRMRNPPYTLVRNRNMLILTRLENANLPADFIETVTPSELDQRGKYETVNCIFDLGDLNGQVIFEELKPLISSTYKDQFAVFQAANQIRVRETGGTLREIRDLIDTAKKRMIGDNQETKVYRLKHIDAETFMLIARGLLGMDPGRDFTSDGALMISREPFGDRLFVRGTPKMQLRFDDTAKVVDVAAEEVEGVEIAKQTFKTYQILVDRKLAYDLLQTVLEGTGARMQQDEVTGSITVLGRVEDHQSVVAALAALDGEGGEAFEIIKVASGDATEIMLAVQSLLRQTTSVDSGVASGPVVMANSLLNQILVRGTPQEVAEVSRMVRQLDDNSVPTELGPRTDTRIINMDEREMGDLTPMMEDLLYSSGRKNRLNIVMPDQRKDVKSRLRGVPDKEPTFDDIWKSGPAGLPPAPKRPEESEERSRSKSNDQQSRSLRQPHQSLWLEGMAVASHVLGLQSLAQTGVLAVPAAIPQEDDSVVGQASDEGLPKNADDYRAPQQRPTVPGAPIEARVTNYGIVLKSDDLDALDDLERLIKNQLGEESAAQLPTFFFLKYRKAENLKSFLEQYFGLADSGGGGGGGGGLMGGMMSNMLGGGTGDLLGGLLGGGGGSSGTGGAGELEGEVRMGMDVPFNAIYVAGATGNDLDQIAELIDVLDQPEAPHMPDMIGEFRTIDILYRDPEEVKTLIEAQIPDYIETGKASEGGQQNNEAAQMMKMLQQLQGGKGGSGSEPEQEKPKARLGVDPTTKRLLVTGPDFIFQKIQKIVFDLDRKELSDPLNMELLPRPGNINSIMDTLNQLFPGKIELVAPTAEAGKSASSTSGASSSSTTPSDAVAKQQQQEMEQARSAIQNAFRQQMQQQQGGGGRGGGGGGGTGGGRGGGGTSGGRGGGGRGQ